MTIEPHANGHPLFIEPGAHNSSRIATRYLRFGPRGGERSAGSCMTYSCPNSEGFAGTAYCRDCAMDLWAIVQQATTDGERAAKMNGEYADHMRFKALVEARAAAKKAEQEHLNSPGHVYYLRVGDLIKIGFTTDITRRMNEYPPNAAVLAAHPGTQRTERDMHRKFSAHLARGREWFTPHAELDEHIITVNNKYPLAETRCMWTGEKLNLAA